MTAMLYVKHDDHYIASLASSFFMLKSWFYRYFMFLFHLSQSVYYHMFYFLSCDPLKSILGHSLTLGL